MSRFVVTPDALGVPVAHVPLPMMWDLAQMISLDTLVVAYQHATNQVLVNFPGADVPTVQHILDELDVSTDLATEAAPYEVGPALHSGRHAARMTQLGSTDFKNEKPIPAGGAPALEEYSINDGTGSVLSRLRNAMRGLTPAQQNNISTLLYKMKTELAVETRCFRALFEAAPDGYVATDLEGTIQHANRSMYNLLRIHAARLEGQLLFKFFTPDSQTLIQRHLRLFQTTLSQTAQVNDLQAQMSLCDATVSVALRFIAIKCDDAAYSTIRWLVRVLEE